MERAWKQLTGNLRLTRVDREVLVFFIFLIVAIGFWFLQTFKESATTTIDYRVELTGVPRNVVITSPLPDKVSVSVSGRGFDIIDYLAKNKRRKLTIDYTTLNRENGLILIDQQQWRRIVSGTLGSSIHFNAITPPNLEIYYTDHNHHKFVPVVHRGTISVDDQHVLCGTEFTPAHVDIYAPTPQYDEILDIPTEPLHLAHLKDTTRVRVALRPPKGVKCIPDSVDALICVDLFATKTLSLPIYCENIPQNEILRPFPLEAQVTFRVSSSLYNRITADDFSLVIDYNTLHAGDTKAALQMRTVPVGVSDLKITPQTVDYLIEKE